LDVDIFETTVDGRYGKENDHDRNQECGTRLVPQGENQSQKAQKRTD